MKAVVIARPGGPEVLEVLERPVPEPGPGEIRVRVRASGLNRVDLLQRRGSYPALSGAPEDVPGIEYAGEVDAAGEGAGLWGVGNRVMGITAGGGHAEYLIVHEREAVRVPKSLSWEEAAAVPEVFMTAYDALFRLLDLAIGEKVLIHAVGSGVGTAAVQLARAAGAITLGTARTPEKLRRARELGLEFAIPAEGLGWVEGVAEATEQTGVHAILDLVGGSYVAGDMRVISLGGRIVVVGLLGGTSTEVDLSTLLRKRARIMGTVLRSRPMEEKIALARAFSKRVLPLLSSGRVHPVIDTVYPFTEIADAHRRLEANDTFGKIVLRWD